MVLNMYRTIPDSFAKFENPGLSAKIPYFFPLNLRFKNFLKRKRVKFLKRKKCFENLKRKMLEFQNEKVWKCF